MLSHKHKIIFVHVPKTAGQSVELFFLQKFEIPWESRGVLLLDKNTDPSKGPFRLAHLTASEYSSLGYVKNEELESYFKFSFVRDPWSRLVSEYKWHGYYRRWSFKDWLYNAFPQPDGTDDWRHVMSQYDYLYDEKGLCLVDFIGHFESLEDDFKVIQTKLGFSLEKLPHVNQTLEQPISIKTSYAKNFARLLWRRIKSKEKFHKTYYDYYDSHTWEWVAKRYAKDIHAFGYTDQLNRFNSISV